MDKKSKKMQDKAEQGMLDFPANPGDSNPTDSGSESNFSVSNVLGDIKEALSNAADAVKEKVGLSPAKPAKKARKAKKKAAPKAAAVAAPEAAPKAAPKKATKKAATKKA
ncbi:MAG: hypothetical protein KBA14_06075, partial [Saprospiraceae bacterium]|nr:hypothetical protein [Saprospiraceae bacterium]